MKRGWGARPKHLRSVQSAQGYTIVESLIFLAVSGAMAVAVMMLISGQQGKAEFQQAVREFEILIQDLSNDITTGYSNTAIPAGEYCSFDAFNNVLVGAVQPTAANRCVFVGTAIQFGVGTDRSQIAIHSLVGRQRAAGKEVETLSQAQAQAMPTAETRSLGPMRVVSVKVNPSTPIGTFGLFTTFQKYDGETLKSGSITSDLVAMSSSSVPQSMADARTAIRQQFQPTGAATLAAMTNPGRGIEICLESTSSAQRARMVIGGDAGKQSAIITTIGGTSECS